jgi:hypothetical protein
MLDGQVDQTVTRTLAALGPRLAEFDSNLFFKVFFIYKYIK